MQALDHKEVLGSAMQHHSILAELIPRVFFKTYNSVQAEKPDYGEGSMNNSSDAEITLNGMQQKLIEVERKRSEAHKCLLEHNKAVLETASKISKFNDSYVSLYTQLRVALQMVCSVGLLI